MPTTADSGSPRVVIDVGALLDDRYRLTAKLGSGGMADVFLAEDERLGRQVAVKVLRRRFDDDDEQLVRRFQVEARAAAMLAHPAIVAVFDQGQAGDHWYLVMEYVRGETLKQRIRREGRLPVARAVALERSVLDALAAAHERHVVHRDVTAQNILLDEAGGVKVADFGIARIGAPTFTKTGTMLGTCHYLSPEQAQGQPADERSDLYSAGVVLFEALTGRVPFEGESEVAVALKHVQEPPPRPSSLAPGMSPALDTVVLKALAKDPSRRFQTAAAFEQALGAAAFEQALGAAAREEAPVGDLASDARPTRVMEQPAERLTVMEKPAGTLAVMEKPAGTLALPPESATRVVPRRSRRGSVIIVLAVAAALAVVALALYAYAFSGVAVPQVVGRTEAQAKSAVRDAGLRPVTHRAYVDGVAEGVVARQRPGRGEVDKGGRVDLWISRGPVHIPAPDLRGLDTEQARQALADVGLVADARKVRSASVEAGLVARQQPSSSVTVARGDTVTYWVSAGPPLAEVPDVVGLSSGDAGAALEDAGFTVNVDLVAGLGEIPGDVVAQDPAAGKKLHRGAEVTIKVAVF